MRSEEFKEAQKRVKSLGSDYIVCIEPTSLNFYVTKKSFIPKLERYDFGGRPFKKEETIWKMNLHYL